MAMWLGRAMHGSMIQDYALLRLKRRRQEQREAVDNRPTEGAPEQQGKSGTG